MPASIRILLLFLFGYSSIYAQTISDIQAYHDSVIDMRASVNQMNLPDSTKEFLLDYYDLCLQVGDVFATVRNTSLLMNQPIRKRIKMRDGLMKIGDEAIKKMLYREQQLYHKLAGQATLQELTYAFKARSELSNRKYFEKDDKDRKGSPVEILLNGVFSFTSTELFDFNAPHYGVKPWEINFRLEPVGFVNENAANMTGAVLSAGLLYNLFPDLSPIADEVNIRETFGSGWIKRLGIKLGGGARYEDKFLWHAGGGLQIRAFTAWGLYSFNEKKWFLAFGLSDLSLVQKYLPYF